MMTAYNRLRPAAIVAIAACFAMTGSCSEKPVAPTPAPAPQPSPSPAPAPSPLPKASLDWRTAPITPGDWQWGEEGGRSVARFAGDKLTLSCSRSIGDVTITRSGTASGPVTMTVVTSNLERSLTANPQTGGIAVILYASDPLLDAMAFSRGRFALETAGLETLYVPSWPEVSRVIEDCRG